MMNQGPMGGGMPGGQGQDGQWLMQLLQALFGQRGQIGMGSGGGMQPPQIGMGTGGGLEGAGGAGPMAGGFPPQPRMPMPGTMDRTTPPSAGPIQSPGQGPWSERPPKMGGY